MVLRTQIESFVAGASAEYHICFALAIKNWISSTLLWRVFSDGTRWPNLTASHWLPLNVRTHGDVSGQHPGGTIRHETTAIVTSTLERWHVRGRTRLVSLLTVWGENMRGENRFTYSRSGSYFTDGLLVSLYLRHRPMAVSPATLN